MSAQENGFLKDGERDGALPTMLRCAGNPCRASEWQRHGDKGLSVCKLPSPVSSDVILGRHIRLASALELGIT